MLDSLPPQLSHGLADGVLTLSFNRPEKKNALTQDMYRGLNAAFALAAEDPSIGCILLRGEGGVFTAGNDLTDFMANDLKAAMAETMILLKRLGQLETPLVAAVDGMAIGIGATLMLHCDFAYATPGSVFKTPFIDLAVTPEAGASVLMPAMLGQPMARRMLMLGEAIPAAEAASAGLISEASDDAEAKARATAAALAAKPREAMRVTKRLLGEGVGAALAPTIEKEAKIFSERLASAEAQAVFAQFFKR